MNLPQKSAFLQGNRWSYRNASIWEELLRQGLDDDGWQWDWTSLGCLARDSGKKARARIVAKSEGVWAADGLVAALEGAFSGIVARARVRDGDRLKPGATVMEWQGEAGLVLALERPFLNLASYVGGIATRTAALVEKVRRACPRNTPRLTATRKTLPGYRDIAIQGVVAGGGYSHRVSLSGGVLIKENHIAVARGVRRAIEGARGVSPHGLKIEVEVRTLSELDQALQAGADAVLLDNFSPALVRQALARIDRISAGQGRRPVVEVSGGLNDENIASYAVEGVDILSVGSLTHSVKAIDLSLLMTGVSRR